MKNSSEVLKKALKIVLWAFIFLLVIGLLTITRVDRTPIQAQDFYRETLDRLDKTPWTGSQGEAWLAGWAKRNTTPNRPVDLVGYAPRGPYEFVQDSSFVKALTLSNGKSQLAWLNFELLIVHPELAKAVEEGVKKADLPLDQLIFTATHTHSGMGGYMPGPLGEMAFGGYDEAIVKLLVDKSVEALKDALSSQDTVSISYRKTSAENHVANRFIQDGPFDPFVRQVIFSKRDQTKAVFFTYSAHATCLDPKFMGLSGDYPKYLTRKMEERDYDFALYAAGTVGSHRPLVKGKSLEQLQEYVASLDSVIWLRMTAFASNNNPRIEYSRLNISLREPHLRISEDLRIRPWLFRYLVGDTNAHLDISLVGNILFVASSGELSGVFYEEWEKLAQSRRLKLIVTTFNGGYIGYITPDELYDERFHEVREMNWYGPGNGTYFDQMIQKIIQRAGK
ncbi:neutral/alkaline non-lysosomal ceramidase N-terminal domain-containing protein [Algoriphagus mannitolivorans]|uniref:neutral/alkaline non-lysosomal ceramidase N-terminal domain-containing protein n=1 Tax=Algoriphagus mannitolivorans TaxID=226504 RepID=UPI000412DBB4|nr:neutral/alkaline non-lysosomal ceramidase N-terminal domain-containing protein [Algoriphagus mannitolivorans]